MQSSGVTYGGKDNFDIVSVLDGKVTNVKEDELLGNIVEVTHDNGIISIYQSLSDVTVKVDEMILRGQTIAKSGTCNLYSKDHNLHFEMIYQGKNINPEENYNKTESELQA